ncbi:LLM class flavin-dependent oxidoreductase [Corynebacterium provencense]|uniref:LLM class flavin-dependent oxidoreductase n=1 Tax=Corynebacterium provencense TaxID=1737425 RepID=UPI00098EF378|nr:LLM class flavin-dependent oxidoreductase [Corynebacterium provencense]
MSTDSSTPAETRPDISSVTSLTPDNDPNLPLKKLGFLTIGTFDPADPATGIHNTLDIIRFGEDLGFDSAWLRNRHMQYGITSPMTVIAAASQITSKINLGTAVTPLGPENPLRIAEDMATVDLLTAGRLNPGVSVGTPFRYDGWKDALYPDTYDREDFSKRRVTRLIENLRGDRVGNFPVLENQEEYSETVQPHSPGLVNRLWYGAGSRGSTQWTAENGLNLLTSSVISAEVSDDFDVNQRSQIDLYRQHYSNAAGGTPRVSQGLVVIPTDHATADQKERYRAYVDHRAEVGVGRLQQFGPRKMITAPDLIGSSGEIAEKLVSLAAFRAVEEVAFALPFTFEDADYRQILSDIAGELAPKLGWSPAA